MRHSLSLGAKGFKILCEVTQKTLNLKEKKSRSPLRGPGIIGETSFAKFGKSRSEHLLIQLHNLVKRDVAWISGSADIGKRLF